MATDLNGTNFYFLDNQGGRSYYLGRYYYKSVNNKTNGVFIELYSDVNVFQPGYSELLLDKKYHEYAGLRIILLQNILMVNLFL